MVLFCTEAMISEVITARRADDNDGSKLLPKPYGGRAVPSFCCAVF